MILHRETILGKLNTCRRALRSKGDVPVLASYCFTEDGDVYAHDGVVVIIEPCSLDGFAGALPGDALRQWLDAVPGDDVEFATTGATSTVWKCGRRKLRLEALPPSAFAVTSLPEPDHAIALDEHFIDYLRVAATSLGTDAMHPALLGVTFDATGNELRFLATDNLSVAVVETGYDVPDALRGTAHIIPPQAVNAVLATKGTPAKWGVSKAWAHFEYDDARAVLTRASTAADANRFDQIVSGVDWNAPFASVYEGLECSLAEIVKVAKTAGMVRAQLRADNGEMRIDCTDGVISVEDVTTFESDGHEDVSAFVNPELLNRVLPYVDEIRLTPNAILLRSEAVRAMVQGLAG